MKYLKKYKGEIIIVLFLVLIVFMVRQISGKLFLGEEEKTENKYLLSFENFSTTKEHQMELKQGDQLYVLVSLQEGEAELSVVSLSGEVIYREDHQGDKDFFVSIEETNSYWIQVKGKATKGSIQFIKNGIKIR